jgi:hypothetical protein
MHAYNPNTLEAECFLLSQKIKTKQMNKQKPKPKSDCYK